MTYNEFINNILETRGDLLQKRKYLYIKIIWKFNVKHLVIMHLFLLRVNFLVRLSGL